MFLSTLTLGFGVCKVVSLVLSVCILLFLVLHDWVDLYPLNDLKVFDIYCSRRNKIIMTIVNTPFFIAYVGLLLWSWSAPFSLCAKTYLVICNALFFAGIIFSWWIPYFFGYPKKQAQELREIYGATHSFLPKIGNNPVPNTMHVIFHVIFVINMIATFMLLY